MLRNNFNLEKNADIGFLENSENNFMIKMNLSSSKLSFDAIVNSIGSANAFLGRPRNFTKIKYA